MVAELWLFFYRHAQRLNCAHVSLLAKVPLLSASISTAAGNSHKLAYFELSKASVAAGLYKAAKTCYSISGRVLRNHTDGLILKLILSKILSEVSTSTDAVDRLTSASVIQQTQLTNQ